MPQSLPTALLAAHFRNTESLYVSDSSFHIAEV
jgi:hypothetical protein